MERPELLEWFITGNTLNEWDKQGSLIHKEFQSHKSAEIRHISCSRKNVPRTKKVVRIPICTSSVYTSAHIYCFKNLENLDTLTRSADQRRVEWGNSVNTLAVWRHLLKSQEQCSYYILLFPKPNGIYSVSSCQVWLFSQILYWEQRFRMSTSGSLFNVKEQNLQALHNFWNSISFSWQQDYIERHILMPELPLQQQAQRRQQYMVRFPCFCNSTALQIVKDRRHLNTDLLHLWTLLF